MAFELLSFNDSAECQADIKSLNPAGTGAKSRRVAWARMQNLGHFVSEAN